jgi:hypothetical protein
MPAPPTAICKVSPAVRLKSPPISAPRPLLRQRNRRGRCCRPARQRRGSDKCLVVGTVKVTRLPV